MLISQLFSKNVILRLTSLKLTLALLFLLTIAVLPGTLLQDPRHYYRNYLLAALFVLFGLHLLLCTVTRWKSLAKSTLIVHCGIILIFVGAMFSLFRTVATVNIYEGDSTNSAFRWDLEQDLPLGLTAKISKINTEFYPTLLKIGVLRNGSKFALETVKTGDNFKLDDAIITVERLEPWKKSAYLTVRKGSKIIGTAYTEGVSTLPEEFPYQFKLVKYQNANIKNFSVDMELLRNGKVVTSGRSAINHPFHYEGMSFYNTSISADDRGRPFAGLQIVRDPGTKIVFSGMALTCLGAVLAFFRRRQSSLSCLAE